MNPDEGKSSFIVCIPTFKRPQLLGRLIDDLREQFARAALVVVVDGDPGSGEVESVLKQKKRQAGCEFLYIRSNHANLSYQRYLAWVYTKEDPAEILLYLDDDLHIQNPEAIENLLKPFEWQESNIVGTTGHIIMGDVQKLNQYDVFVDQPSANPAIAYAVRTFGAANRVKREGSALRDIVSHPRLPIKRT